MGLIAPALGEEPPENDAQRSPVRLFAEGGGVGQFGADLDTGGDFDVTRGFVRSGLTWTPDPRLSVSFTAGFGRDEYSFAGDAGLGGLRPWDDVESVRLGVSMRWSVDDTLTVFATPALRFAAESGVSLDDGLTAGIITGVSYKISDRLSIGPGIGVASQLEDSVNVIPVVFVDWRITDTLSLRTGGGSGAMRGPGPALVWEIDDDWSFTFGARYSRFRFRLDDEGVAPRGVGEEESFPIYAGLTWNATDNVEASVIGGINLAGELTLEDEDGNFVAGDDADPAGFVGFTLRIRF
ncbi:MAG: hypothetical protein HKO59_09445 [Phycisphaerales bacterium]|nr:hypothetical protein [Phycisphaerales bacterium]